MFQTYLIKLQRMGKSVCQSIEKTRSNQNQKTLKPKVIRGNNKPFITKILRKAIMCRGRRIVLAVCGWEQILEYGQRLKRSFICS